MREPWEIAVDLASLLSLAILAYVVSKPPCKSVGGGQVSA